MGKGKGESRRVKFGEAFPIQDVYRGDTDERKSHMNVHNGWGSAGLRRGTRILLEPSLRQCWLRGCEKS